MGGQIDGKIKWIYYNICGEEDTGVEWKGIIRFITLLLVGLPH